MIVMVHYYQVYAYTVSNVYLDTTKAIGKAELIVCSHHFLDMSFLLNILDCITKSCR